MKRKIMKEICTNYLYNKYKYIMLEFEVLGIKINLLNMIVFIVIGILFACFTICSCANVENIFKRDFEYEIKKFMHTYL